LGGGWAKTVAEMGNNRGPIPLAKGQADPPMTLRSATKTLLVLVLALPMAQIVLISVRGLLISMGDADGGAIIGHVGTLCQVVWALCLVALVIVLALVVLNDRAAENEE
jgi:hypothetical protein